MLVPMASWQVWIFPSLPNYYAQHVLIWPCLVFMFWAWGRGLWSLGEAWSLALPFLPWLALLLLLQIWADWQSASVYAPGAAPLAVVVSLLKLLVQLPFLLFFALLCRVLLRKERNQKALLAGTLAVFVLLCLQCMVQVLYISIGYSIRKEVLNPESGWQSLGTLLGEFLRHVSPWLESRWPEAVYDFYSRGGYVLTIGRVNGFFEEASALAAILAVFFLPLGFGLLAVASRNRRRDAGWRSESCLVLGWIIIVVCLVLLMLCQSLTGVIAALVLCVLCLRPFARLWFSQGMTGKMIVLLLSAAVAIACLSAMKSGAGISTVDFLKNKIAVMQTRLPPRIIVTLDTLELIARHPLTGVGRDWYFAHLHEGRRFMDNLSHPELHFWKKRGTGGELSALPALAAQYGLPVTLAAIWFTAGICHRLCRLHRRHPRNALLAFMAGAAPVWFVMALCISLASVDIRNPLFSLPFYCFLAVAQGVGAPEDGQKTL